MSADDAILSFLSQAENLPLAVEISEYVEMLKDGLQKTFWEALSVQVPQQMVEAGIDASWGYVPFVMARAGSPWKHCYIRPLNSSSKAFFQVGLGQSTREGHFTLFRGILRSDAPLPGLSAAKQSELKETMRAQQLVRKDPGKDPIWVGWEFYPYQLHGTDFMIEMARDMDGAVRKVTDDWLALFKSVRPLLEEINVSLAGENK